MTTFVVSLFLPHTVSFNDLPSSVREDSSKTSAFPGTSGSLGTILAPFTPFHPQSPAIGSGTRFNPHQPGNGTSLFPSVVTPQPRTPFIEAPEFFGTTETSSPHFRSFVPSDSHTLEWGEGEIFNQPRSRADPAPPPTILEYSKELLQDQLSRQKQQEPQEKIELGYDGHHEGTESRKRPEGNGRRLEDSERGLRLPLGRKKPAQNDNSTSSDYFPKSQWTIEPSAKVNGGLTNAVRAAMADEGTGDVFWVGTLGFPTGSLSASVKDEIQEKLEMEYDTLAVYVSDSDFDGHYEHYCKTILWPVFHYQIPDHPKSKAYEDHSWEYYVHVNQTVADKIIKTYKRGDKIWVHDYHLLLVPKMVRQKLPEAQIGFFLHSAFPSSEVFRCLSVRKQLLEGILGANLVAFQIKEYAMHFLQTCSRLLIVEVTNDGVQLENRFVNVTWLAIGIDLQRVLRAQQEPLVLDSIKLLLERYHDKHLIVARDKLDNVRGVRQKLLAYELFLNKYPEWREKVVMIQVATPLSDQLDLNEVISTIVTRIDSMHSTLTYQPLVFLRRNISFPQYISLLTAADIMLVTSLREGMNLTAHEFIACQSEGQSAKKHGPLILSEFTGTSSIFEGNDISVNPWHYQQVASAIKTALEMKPDERKRRHKRLYDIIARNNGSFWFKTLNSALTRVHEEHVMRDTMSVPRLSLAQLSEKYKKTSKRLFILDYEGTLTSPGKPSDLILTSPQRVLDCLNELLLDRKNIVYVMSAYKPEELERLFSRVPKLGIIAENGCFVREFGSDEWVPFANPAAMESWKREVRHMLQYYLERLDGSWIETRCCSMILHYNKVENLESATRQAGDCANHIDDACRDQRIHAVPIDQALLIEPIDWNKGTAAAWIMENFSRQSRRDTVKEETKAITKTQKSGDSENVATLSQTSSPSSSATSSASSSSLSLASPRLPEFLLVAGSDRQDEGVFRWANQLGKEDRIRYVTTVSVGKRNTEAMASITQGSTGLVSILQRIAKVT